MTKTRIRKGMTVLTVLCMLFVMLPVYAFAASSTSVDGEGTQAGIAAPALNDGPGNLVRSKGVGAIAVIAPTPTLPPTPFPVPGPGSGGATITPTPMPSSPPTPTPWQDEDPIIIVIDVSPTPTTTPTPIPSSSPLPTSDPNAGSVGRDRATPSPTPVSTPLPTLAPTPSTSAEPPLLEKPAIISVGLKPATDPTTRAAAAATDFDTVKNLVGQAKKAEASGQKAVIEIKIESAADTKTVKVEIPGDSFKQVADTTNAGVRVDTGIGTVTFDTKAVDSINGAASAGDISISMGKVDKSSLTEELVVKVGDRPVYDFSVKAGSTEISSFGDGKAEISIPYTPNAGEKENAIVVYYIDNAGNLKTVQGRYDPAIGAVKFNTGHFSQYAVGYNEVSFSDVLANVWYSEAVGFMAARSIANGVGDGRFAPVNNVIRADFLVMVMNSYGIEPDASVDNNFSDAGNKYYTAYLGTAKRLGLVSGIGSNKYAPEATISRQDMFVILYRVLDKLGELPAGTSGKNLEDFNDTGDMAAYAKDAMKLFVETGIISGDGRNLNPKATSTRAQAAQVLYNLLSK